MNILDFLMDNIFFVLIALGFIFKLVGGANSQKKPPSIPSFGGEQAPTQTEVPDYSYEKEFERPTQLEQRNKPVEYKEFKPKTSQFPSQEIARSYQEKEKAVGNHSFSPIKEPVNVNNGIASKSNVTLSQEEIRRAVIWSEILGSPRSRVRNSRFRR